MTPVPVFTTINFLCILQVKPIG